MRAGGIRRVRAPPHRTRASDDDGEYLGAKQRTRLRRTSTASKNVERALHRPGAPVGARGHRSAGCRRRQAEHPHPVRHRRSRPDAPPGRDQPPHRLAGGAFRPSPRRCHAGFLGSAVRADRRCPGERARDCVGLDPGRAGGAGRRFDRSVGARRAAPAGGHGSAAGEAPRGGHRVARGPHVRGGAGAAGAARRAPPGSAAAGGHASRRRGHARRRAANESCCLSPTSRTVCCARTLCARR
jgi:hypothetical protein